MTALPAKSSVSSALRWLHDLPPVVIAALAALRLLVTMTSDRHFDVDPLVGEIAFPGFGPGEALLLDLVVITMAVCFFASRAALNRPLRRVLLWCALPPMAVLVLHAVRDASEVSFAFSWSAAVLGMLVIAHAASDRRVGPGVLALLLAGIVPVAVRGVLQVDVPAIGYQGMEFAEQIAGFESSRDRFFAEKGWDPDSASARIFERRLRQAQPLGWFPTTNIFASLMACAVVIGGAIGLFGGAGRLRAAGALAAVGAALLLIPTGSKGAWAATLFGVLLLGGVFACVRTRGPLAAWRLVRMAAVLAVPGVLLAVVVRRWILPETFAGDLSLLFRGHYLEAAFAMVRDHPIFGVGPDGFGRLYPLYRPARNPEEVLSAHGWLVDVVAAMGIWGFLWWAMIGVFLWGAASVLRADSTSVESTSPEADVVRRASWRIGVLMLLTAAFALRVEAAALHGALPIWRLTGVVLAGAAAVWVVRLAHAEGPARKALNIGLAVAAVVLMVHAQIEMTAVLPGSAAWSLALLGVAFARGMEDREEMPSEGGLPARWAVPVVLALALFGGGLFGARPLLRQEAAIADAAAHLRGSAPLVASREGVARDVELFRLRREAAERLSEAFHAGPARSQPVRAAVRMLRHGWTLPGGGSPTARRELLDLAEALVGEAIERAPRTELYAERRQVYEWRYLLLQDADALDAALRDAREVVRRDPNGLDPAYVLARLLIVRGEEEAARAAAHRVLEIDAAFSLDPLKQLTDAQRAEVRGWGLSPSVSSVWADGAADRSAEEVGEGAEEGGGELQEYAGE